MRTCIQKVSPFRTDVYIDSLVSKLADEGLRYAREVVLATKASVEMKLSSHPALKMDEVNDCLTIWSAVQRTVEIEADIKQGIRKGPHHYCAHVNHNDANWKRKRSSCSRTDIDAYSRAVTSRSQATHPSHQHVKPEFVAEEDVKTDLWRAIEVGGDASIADLVLEVANAEEREEG